MRVYSRQWSKKKKKDIEPLPPLAGQPITYGPDKPYVPTDASQPQQTPQRSRSPSPPWYDDPVIKAAAKKLAAKKAAETSAPAAEKKVRLEPSAEAVPDGQPREVSSGVNFQSEYDKDIADGWTPVYQKGQIVAMTMIVEGKNGPETKTKPPGKGNPFPPRRARSLSISRDASAPPVEDLVDKPRDLFVYPEGCKPTAVRNAKGKTTPPEPIKDVEIRPGEFLYLKRQQTRRTVWEVELTGEMQKNTPFLDWSANRILPCDSCGKHLAPICSRCQVSTCFDCSKLLSHWRGQDQKRAEAGMPYLVSCNCSHKYKRDRDRSPRTSERADHAWQASVGHRTHDIHPGVGMLKSPCGLIAPSNKHPDRVPRNVSSVLFPHGWEPQPLAELCDEAPAPKAPRRRSRSPPRQRSQGQGSYSGSYPDAPWRDQAFLRPAVGAIVLKDRATVASAEEVRLSPREVFPNLQQRAQSAPRKLELAKRPTSPQRKPSGSRKREQSLSFQEMKNKKRVVLESVLQMTDVKDS